MSSFKDLINVGYKRAVYGTLIVTCITPGILYLYLKDFSTFASLTNIKTVLFGLAIAAPVIVFNITIAFVVVYLSFTQEKYKEGKRLKEEVLNRIIFMSSLLATSFSLNLYVVGLYFIQFKPSNWHKVLIFLFDIIIIFICVFPMKTKADNDLFHHDFQG